MSCFVVAPCWARGRVLGLFLSQQLSDDGPLLLILLLFEEFSEEANVLIVG